MPAIARPNPQRPIGVTAAAPLTPIRAAVVDAELISGACCGEVAEPVGLAQPVIVVGACTTHLGVRLVEQIALSV